ncbi:MAG: tetratricopeptide repeat protein [archaeon]|nr:tetratricopeptide repeat protein [archaeon]
MATISLCIVSRNEAENLKGLLESTKNLVNEIIYVDTGSKDNSIKIAEEFECKIFNYEQKEGEWIEGARNLSLAQATSEWILVLDSDERISTLDFEKIKNLTENKEYIGYYLIQRQYTNKIGVPGWISSKEDRYSESKIASGWYENPILRLFINDKRIKYKGRPHDLVDESVKAIGKTCLTDIPIHHFGVLENKSPEKIERNEKFLIEYLNDSNNNEKYYTCYQLASEYLAKNNLEEAKKYLNKCLELNENYAPALLNLGSIYIKEKNYDKAEKFIIEALKLETNAAAENNLGVIYSEKAEFNRALKKFQKAVELNPKSADYNFNIGIIYLKMHKENKAKPYFEKAIELNPEYKKRVQFN